MTQKQALTILQQGHNVFLTGAAGSGKTFLLDKFIKLISATEKRIAVTATTGLAATHLRGRTIHSWVGIGIADQLTRSQLNKIITSTKLQENIRTTNILIIDEISMLHDFRLDMIDQVCREVRRNPKVFGGLQVVLSGDFFQLPPITKDANLKLEKTSFITNSEAWQAADFKICYLREQHRQTDDNQLTDILNALRNNVLTNQHVDLLRNRILPNPGNLTELHCHNLDIDQINKKRLAEIPHKEYQFAGEKLNPHRDKKLLDQLLRNCLAEELLKLKQDALVMFIKNDTQNQYINGSLGKIKGFHSRDGYPIIELNSGKTIFVDLATWSITQDEVELVRFRQLPLKLAWAMTIHKSQGMTLDGAFIDLSKAFETGMGYVALSRLKSLEGLYLKGFNETALQINPEVLRIDQYFQQASRRLEMQAF